MQNLITLHCCDISKICTHVATLVSLFQSQLHAQSLPDTLFPVIHSTPSLPQLVLVALPPSFLSPFSPLWGIAAQIYLSPLLIIPPMFLLLWSLFSTPSTLHFSLQLTISLLDLYSFPQSVSALLPFLHSSASLRTNLSPTFPSGHLHVLENVQWTLKSGSNPQWLQRKCHFSPLTPPPLFVHCTVNQFRRTLHMNPSTHRKV